MDKSLIRIATQESLVDTLKAGREEAQRLGVISTTFHVAKPQASQIGPEVFITSFGQPDDWRRAYNRPDVRKHDPIPDLSMRLGTSMTFVEILDQVTPTREQAEYIERLKQTPMIHSLACPVYGPFDFDNFASFCIGRPFGPEDENLTVQLIALAEITNRRCAQFFQAMRAENVNFSTRENEVLNWMGRSKSTTDIATIMGVSAATIDTFVRRIFAKLEVNDRISAVLKGVRLGYVRF